MLSDTVVSELVINITMFITVTIDASLATMVAKKSRSDRIVAGLCAMLIAMILEHDIMLFIVLAFIFSSGG